MNKEKGKMRKEGRIESRDEGSKDVSNDRWVEGNYKRGNKDEECEKQKC